MAEKLSTTRNSPFCKRILFLSVFNTGLTVGYAFTCLNPLVPVIENLYNSTFQVRYGVNIPASQSTTLLSLTFSMMLAGAFFGSLSVQYVLRILTRKQTMIFWNVLYILGAVVISAGTGLTGSYEAFIIGRTVLGFAAGIGLNAALVVASEYSTKSNLGYYQSLFGAGLGAGEVVGVVIAHPMVLGSIHRWPGMIILNALPPLLFICFSPWIPESPYTILREDKRAEAISVLKRLRCFDKDENILAEITLMEEEQRGLRDARDEGNEKEASKKKFAGISEILRTPTYRRQLFLVAMLYGCTMAVGVNHALFFSDQIFIKGGIPPDVVTYVTIGVFTINGAATFAGMKILKMIGGRKLLIGGTCTVVISHVITVTSLATRHLSPIAGYMSIVGILLLLMSVFGALNIAMLALAGELTIEPTRQTIFTYCGGVVWFTGWWTGFVAPYLDVALGPYAFLVWFAVSVLYLILAFFLIPETKGKTTAQIQESLKKGYSQEMCLGGC